MELHETITASLVARESIVRMTVCVVPLDLVTKKPHDLSNLIAGVTILRPVFWIKQEEKPHAA